MRFHRACAIFRGIKFGGLFYGPGFAGEDHIAEFVEAFSGAHFFDLLRDAFVVSRSGDIAYHADSQRQTVAVHHRKLLMQEVAFAVGVVDEYVVDSIAVFTYGHSFEQEPVLNEAAVVVGAEDHLFAVAEMDCLVGAHRLVSDRVMDAVIEDHAVLQYLHDRCTLVAGSGGENLNRRCELDIDRAREEIAAGTEHEFRRDKRIFGRAVRR